MTAFTDFLADPGAVRRWSNWLAELTPVDSAGTPETLRVASRLEGFRTHTSDTPANTLYRPDLRRGLELASGLWRGGGDVTIGGASLPSEAKLVLWNADGHYDDYSTRNGWSWGGRDCIVRFGSGWGSVGHPGFMAYGDFRPFRFRMGEPQIGRPKVEIPIYGLDRRFDHPLTTLVYRGTGPCIHFASSAYSDHGTPAKLDLTGSMVWEGWYYVDNLSANRIIGGWFDGATRWPFNVLVLSSGAFSFNYTHSGGTGVTHSMTATLSAGRWYHLAVAVSGTAGTFITYDGTTGTEVVETFTTAAATRDANVGGTFRLGRNAATSWIGERDEERVWNAARTAEQIRENRHGEVVVVPAELVGYWKHNDGTGTTTTDTGTGSKADGTLNGTTTWYHSLEGDSSLAGQTKPDAWGWNDYQEPVLVDPSRLIYQVAGAGAATSIVPADGLSHYTSAGADITSHRTLQTTVIGSAGQYRTHLARGLFKLAAPAPTLKLSAIVAGYDYTNDKTKGELIRAIITTRGPDPPADPGDLDTAAFTAIDTADDSTHGLYVRAGESVTIRQALDRLIGPASWYGFDFDSEDFTLAQFTGPAVTADLTIPASHILEFEPVGSALLAWLVELRFGKILPHGESEIAATVKTAALDRYQRGRLNEGWSIAPAQDAEIRDQHPEALRVSFDTQIQYPDPGGTPSSAQARDAALREARRILDLVSQGYEPYRCRTDPIGLQLRLGDTFAPVVQQGRGVYRFGCDGTRNFVALALKVDPLTYNVEIVGLG